MRTTLNLDDDVAAAVAEAARRDGRSRSRVVNDLVRAGMRATRESHAPVPYDPPAFDTGRPLLDVTDVGTALELLDDAG
jgi:hypothetical protein